MNSEVLVAILSLLGTAFGSVVGILTSNKLTLYRIEQLEKKVEKHNSVVERTITLEHEMEFVERRIDDVIHDIHKEEFHHEN